LDGLKRIEELDLSDNKIERLRNLQSLRYLRSLNLSSNLINSIEGVELLARLQSLDLSGNLIERIPSLAKHLGALSSLNLQNNKLSTLRDIVHLKQLKNLSDLTISPNPIMDLDHARLFIVFHLSCLNELDGQVISEAEREEARERFAADELQQIEFEMHTAQLEVQRLKEQLVVKEQKIEKLEAALREKETASDDVKAANDAVLQELATTSAMLDKKTAEVASLSELLYELKQEIAFHNIDSQFGSMMPASAGRRGPFGSGITESPYLGMGSSRIRGSIDTPEKTMANLLSQLDAVAQEEDALAKGKENEETEEPVSDVIEATTNDDDKLDTASWIDENQPKDVSDELADLEKRLEELQTQFYAALAEGRSSDAEAFAAEIEQLKLKKQLLESQQLRFEEWKASEEEKQRAALEKSIEQLRAELHSKEEMLFQSKLKAQIDIKVSASPSGNKAERRMSLEQLVKRDLPTETLAAAGGHDSSASPQLREFLALVEQDHINRIVALIGEVSHPHEAPSDSGSPRSLDEAIQMLRQYLLSHGSNPSASEAVNSPAREQGQPNPQDMALVPLPSDSTLPAHVRERLGQLEAQLSMLEDAKLETFFSEGEDWEQLAMAMKTLQQQTKLLNTANPETIQPANEEDRLALEVAKELKDQTTDLQQNLAANMAALKQMWLTGKIRADPEVEKSSAWKYWTQMSQFQFFYFHLKMQLAHMNQMLQLRQRQLLDVQNRLLDAKFDQDSGITAARLVPVAAVDTILVTPAKSEPRQPVITSLPPTPVSNNVGVNATNVDPADVVADPQTTPSVVVEPIVHEQPPAAEPLTATVQLNDTPSQITSLATSEQLPEARTTFQAPNQQPDLPQEPELHLDAPSSLQPHVDIIEKAVQNDLVEKAVEAKVAPAPAERSAPTQPIKKSPFLSSKPSTPTPAPAADPPSANLVPVPALRIPDEAQKPAATLSSDHSEKPAAAVVSEKPSSPVADSSSTMTQNIVTPPALASPEPIQSAPQQLISPRPKPSDSTVQNLMERLEKAAAESGGAAPTSVPTSQQAPQQSSHTADVPKLGVTAPPKQTEQPTPPKPAVPATQSAPVGKPPLPPTAASSPATSSQPTLVKKSPFLLADKQKQASSSAAPAPTTSSPKRPTLARAQTVTPSSPSSVPSPAPSPSPAKSHKRAPSDSGPIIVESLSPRQTPESSPVKATLTRKTSGGLLLKPASSTVPGIFSLSGMSSPAGSETSEGSDKSPSPSRSPSPPPSDSDGMSSGRTSPSPSASPAPFDDEVFRPRKSRPGSGIIDWSKIDNNLKPVAAARPSDNLLAPVQKSSSVRTLLSRSNSLAKPDSDGK
jgi:hypothetical protein